MQNKTIIIIKQTGLIIEPYGQK